MNRERFESLVAMAIEKLPQEFLDRLENVALVVEDFPTATQLSKTRVKHSHTLLGLYEGVPQTKRGGHYNLVTPDKITIFQKPIESKCRYDADIADEIRRVVQHEIAHHFGINEVSLRQVEEERFKHGGK